MNTNAQTDLIALKTSEFDNLPGLILGLDGWILRSLPKEHRAQFLNGYEKLLRVVFHPDRYSDKVKKQSRQNYLQSVNEAVRFMLADEFSYEITTDTVPTRKNPLVSLQNAIEARDGIIGRLDDRSRETQAYLDATVKENSDLKMRLLKAESERDFATTLNHRLNLITRLVVRGFPVPVNLRFATVTGGFLDVLPDSDLHLAITRNSSTSSVSPEHEWIAKGSWLKEAKNQGLITDCRTVDFKRTISGDGLLICGAMTIAHLCELIRKLTGASGDSNLTASAFGELQKEIGSDSEHEAYMMPIKPFLIPFYNSGMILLVQVAKRNTKKLHHRLFAVESVNAESNLNEAVLSGWKKECAKLTAENFDLRRSNKGLKFSNSTMLKMLGAQGKELIDTPSNY